MANCPVDEPSTITWMKNRGIDNQFAKVIKYLSSLRMSLCNVERFFSIFN